MTDCDCEKAAEQIVFISCVDEVRYSFISHLSDALGRKGIDVFVDSGDLLSKEAQAKVEKARVSVVVLPGNREPATAYIDKLLKILKCQRNNDQVVVPVLYGVGPAESQWLSALQKMSGLSQCHKSREECSDSKLVKEIVRDVYENLFYMGRIGIYSKLLEIENMVCKQPLGIHHVGIWGMPGIGKTTLAKAVFDQVSGEFEACCFIEDYDGVIREKGLYRVLEEQFLKENAAASTISKLSLLRDKLNNKRVLVVLDDVRNPLTVESFLRGFDWFGPESLIIITSRDKQVFRLCRVNQIYEVQGLNEKEALQLFLLYASIEGMGEQNIHELSVKVIKYANGNPLALRNYGRELKGKENLSEMHNAFLKLKQCPPPEIVHVVKSSYDTLTDSEKNIFLDIACFFRGENVDYVIQLLEGCDLFPHVGVDVLIDKCLVTISENLLQMHNLIQDVGREIINGETIRIERRRRLWEPWSIKYLLEDNEHKTPFKRAQGTEIIEGMFLDTSNLGFDVKPSAFENMLKLRLLKIYSSNSEIHPVLSFPKGFLHSLPKELRLLHWENYPLQFLPQNFDPMHLVEINMPYSQLHKLWGGTKNLEMLKTIRLCHSQQLVDIDDVLKAQNLEVIDFQGCTRLQSFPATGQLVHLRDVNLSGCREIKIFPKVPPNIETLHLQGTGIIGLPLSTIKPNGRELESLLAELSGLSDALKLERLTSLVKTSSSCQDLGKLICLNLKDCSRLQSLPDMGNLEFLKVLDLSGCSELETIQGFPRNLKELYLAGTAVREVPQLPQSLELFNAHGCVYLKSVYLDRDQFPMHYTFSNCSDLSPQVVNEFLVKMLANVKHIPREHQQELNKALVFSFCAPSHQNSTLELQPGSSVMTRLTSSQSRTLVGFTILVEVAFSEDDYDVTGFGIRYVCRWKNKKGHTHREEKTFHMWAPGEAIKNLQKDHIFVFCDVKTCPSTGEGNDPDILADLIVFEFFPINKQKKCLNDSCTVKRCGVYTIAAATTNTSLRTSSPVLSLDPIEFSGNEVQEVLRFRYDGLPETDKVLFLYIACLFNDEDAGLVAPLTAGIEFGLSSGIKALANRSLIRISPNGEIIMHSLLRKFGKEILDRRFLQPDSSKDLSQHSEKVYVASSSSPNWKYDVFPSFSGLDVRRNFLSHFLVALKRKSIKVFEDTEIERSQEIGSFILQAIRGSRISVVVLSKNYSSSTWLLNELVEIMSCRENMGQRVIPIFYYVDPSDVRKQTGEFGLAFQQVCENITEDVKQRYCQALYDISTISGYPIWGTEADMIETVTDAISEELNITISKDFGDFVGIEDHISKMKSLLCLESEEVRMVGIWGPSGIGKSTIARALFNRLARQFQRSIFVDKAFADKNFENSRRSNLDDYGTKLHLQTQFLSKFLDQKYVKRHHLGMVEERLKRQKVLIILDDASNLVLLDALVGKTRWFGSGSRIVVVTKDIRLLKSHGINYVYEVDFPSEKQALEMFCQYAFRHKFPPHDYTELAAEAVQLAGNRPLDLNVLGLALRGRNKEVWMNMLHRLKNSLTGGIEKTLGVRRESLTEDDEVLPLRSPFPMASYSSHNWKYHVYMSFCGLDVRKSFLSHFLKELNSKSIITFVENEMDLTQPSNAALSIQAMRESRISIVMISSKYASSTRLLNELVEITKCKEELTQKLIPIFYDVEPSDVRKQTGEFGTHFNETCNRETEDVKQQWRQALIHIANLSGFYSRQWNNEAEMIEKIVNGVSDTLSCTPSIDFSDLVGIKSHIATMNSLLCLESDEVMMVGIWGPPGIGKTTIARALYSDLASEFQQSAFMVISNDYTRTNLDDYGVKLHFQTLFLSKILGQKDIRISHLGVVQERLKDQKVLIILDDVDDLRVLDALVGQTRWFGSGSRIIVITKDKGLLKSHGIDNVYKVNLPSKKKALRMFCRSAFGQNHPPDGFTEIANKVAETVGNLPLGLKVLGSSLRGRDKTEWMAILPRISDNLYGELEKVLRVGYDRLEDHDKFIFLHIACLFNYDTVEAVTQLLADSDLNVVLGLTSLAEKSLIHITEHGNITMDRWQQNLGRDIVRMESSHEPGGRRFLVDSLDICDVLMNNTGTESVLGISLDMSEINELHISERGFNGMGNLLFLKFYTNLWNKIVKVHLPDGLDYLSRKLRLLHWESFPMRCMPPNFTPENLVELVMEASELEMLWSGIQPLGRLKCMSLRDSLHFREISDLSYATTLEKLDLGGCSSLMMLPSSIKNLHQLRDLDMEGCIKLEALPTDINLESLYCLNLKGCSQLTSFPEISRNISDLYLDGTAIEEVPWWIDNLSSLSNLSMNGCNKLKKISPNISKLKLLEEVDFSECEALTEDSWENHPEETSASLLRVNMSFNSFERVPDTWTSIQPKDLIFNNCRNLQSLPELPASLSMLTANNCESLENLHGSFRYPHTALQFINCFNLNQQARDLILQSECAYAILPGGEIPAQFTHRTDGSFLKISLPESSLSKKFPSFKACIMVESRSNWFYFGVIWPVKGGTDKIDFSCLTNTPSTRNHLIVFNCEFSPDDSPAELDYSNLQFEFFCLDHRKELMKIKECGVQLLEEVSSSVNNSGKRSEK